MSMILTCTHCYSVDYHRLNLETGNVVCLKCGKDVEVTSVAKKVLENSKQVVKTVRSENELFCEVCKSTATPYVRKKSATNYEVVCSVCNSVHKHHTKFFADMWRNKEGIRIENYKNLVPVKVSKSSDEDSDVELETGNEELEQNSQPDEVENDSNQNDFDVDVVEAVKPETEASSPAETKRKVAPDPESEKRAKAKAEALLNSEATLQVSQRPVPADLKMNDLDLVTNVIDVIDDQNE